ncbi:MAG: hypothetical protein AAFX87_13065 [Bacteroidota bacterium]
MIKPYGAEKLKISETNRRDELVITQELIVEKNKFLRELFNNILLFNAFYSRVHGIDMSYLNQELDRAKELIEGL